MNDLTIYCMSIHPKNLNTIKELNYIPVGLYNENFYILIVNYLN